MVSCYHLFHIDLSSIYLEKYPFIQKSKICKILHVESSKKNGLKYWIQRKKNAFTFESFELIQCVTLLEKNTFRLKLNYPFMMLLVIF